MKDFMAYVSSFDRRLVVPIYNCEKDLEFSCMNNVDIAKALGFHSRKVGNIEKIIPHNFDTVADVARYFSGTAIDESCMNSEINDFKAHRNICTVPFGGGSFGPLTVVSDIVGVDHLIRLSRKSPDLIDALLNHVTNYIIGLAQKEAALGADYYWIAEPLASLFPPKLFDALCGRYLKRIYESIAIAPALHVCGNTTAHTEKLLATGAKLLSIDWMTDLAFCLKSVPKDVVVMGNIDPVLIWQGNTEEILQATKNALDIAENYRNFILSSGCLIPADTPMEKVQILIDAVR